MVHEDLACLKYGMNCDQNSVLKARRAAASSPPPGNQPLATAFLAHHSGVKLAHLTLAHSGAKCTRDSSSQRCQASAHDSSSQRCQSRTHVTLAHSNGKLAHGRRYRTFQGTILSETKAHPRHKTAGLERVPQVRQGTGRLWEKAISPTCRVAWLERGGKAESRAGHSSSSDVGGGPAPAPLLLDCLPRLSSSSSFKPASPHPSCISTLHHLNPPPSQPSCISTLLRFNPPPFQPSTISTLPPFQPSASCNERTAFAREMKLGRVPRGMRELAMVITLSSPKVRVGTLLE